MPRKLPTAKKTRKKFYNRYVYKVSLSIPGIGILRWHDFNSLREMCLYPKNQPHLPVWREDTVVQVFDYRKLWLSLTTLLKSHEGEYSRRLQIDTLDLYTNNDTLYGRLCDDFRDCIRLRSEPKKGMEQCLQGSDKSIFVNKLPHDRYQYRAYLKPHRIETAARKGIAGWLKNQVPRITFTDSIERWLLTNNENWDRRYIHVEDENTLLMIQLRAPRLVGKIFKYTLNR